MVDIQSATAALTSATTATVPALTPIQVAIADISQALANLTQTIQTNAMPVALSDNGTSLTLATSLGAITVTLAQQLDVAEKQNLTQQLIDLIQTQKPLTLSLQPGAPPTQGVLLVPMAPAAAPSLTQALQSPAQILLVPPLAVGETLPAIVLSNPSSPPQVAPAIPALLTPLTPNLALPPAPSLVPTALPLQTPPIAPLVTPVPLNATSTAVVATAPVPTAITTATPSSLPAIPLTLPLQPVSTPATALPPAAPTVSLPATLATAIIVATPPTAPAAVISASQPLTPSAAALLQPGNEVTLHIDNILPPAVDNAPPALAPNQILATVTAAGPTGNLILKAGDTSLFVKAPLSAPVGTTVVVTVDIAKDIPLLILRPLEQGNFPALPQTLATLAQSAPQALAQIMNNYMPQPTAILPGALMFLFSAFKQGNVRGWLGDDATNILLRLGKLDLVTSLSRNLSEAGQPAQDTVVGEWRAYPIPLYAQQQFQALTLYVHRDPDARRDPSGDESGAPNTVRFLIDMRLSKLGAMQVDGFVQQKKLDMILRSETNLPDGLHNELRASYIRAVGAVGYAGTLSFQVGRRHWMNMQQPATPGIVT